MKKKLLSVKTRTILIAILMFVVLSTHAFCDGFSATESMVKIENAVHDGTKEIYDIASAIVLPLAAVLVAWAGVKVLFQGEKGMEKVKNTMLRVIVVIMLVYLSPSIIIWVRDTFQTNTGATNSINSMRTIWNSK